MHSAVQRANVVGTFSALLLAALCATASFLDAFHLDHPSSSLQAHVQVSSHLSILL